MTRCWRSVRSSPPFANLSVAGAFDGVLDLLAGLYPSDEFAELRPRVTWDRVQQYLDDAACRGPSGLLAIINGGTIPDRGTLWRVSVGHAMTKADSGGRTR